MSDLSEEELANQINADLFKQFGIMIGGADLSKVLGYRNYDAFRQAVRRETISIPLFRVPHRKGRFALTKDIATWLAKMRFTSVKSETKEEEMK